MILTRHETSPDDVHGMKAAAGFLTAFGGMSSHAALVARQMGKEAVVGCASLSFDYRARTKRDEFRTITDQVTSAELDTYLSLF